MENVVGFLCNLFLTVPARLGDVLNHPEHYKKAVDLLKRSRLVTSYHKPTGKKVVVDHISTQSASKVYAYEGYLDVRVRQHMYSKHRIVLDHAYLPCLAVKVKEGHYRYYPMELVLLERNPVEDENAVYETFSSLQIADSKQGMSEWSYLSENLYDLN